MRAHQHGPLAEPISARENEQRDHRDIGAVDPRLVAGSQEIRQSGKQDAAIAIRWDIHVARETTLHKRIVRDRAIHFTVEATTRKEVDGEELPEQ